MGRLVVEKATEAERGCFMKMENVPLIGWFASRCRALARNSFEMNRRLRSIDVQLKMMRMQDGVFSFPYGEMSLKMYLPYAGIDSIQTQIVDAGAFWEQPQLERVRRYVKPGAVVADCGANIGNHTLFFARVCEAGKIYAFEPQRSCVDILTRNLELNDAQKRVEVCPLVLGAKSGKASVAHREAGNVGGTSFVDDASGMIDMRTLDSFNLERLDFLKIDVEGAHYDLLMGARDTLKRCAPVIWVEMFANAHGDDLYDHDREWVLPRRFLDECGYELKERLSETDFLYVRKS